MMANGSEVPDQIVMEMSGLPLARRFCHDLYNLIVPMLVIHKYACSIAASRQHSSEVCTNAGFFLRLNCVDF